MPAPALLPVLAGPKPHMELQPQTAGAAVLLPPRHPGLRTQFKVLLGTKTDFEGNLLQLESS